MSHAEHKATKNTLNAVSKWLSADVLLGSRWLSTIVPPILNLNTRSLKGKWDGFGPVPYVAASRRAENLNQYSDLDVCAGIVRGIPGSISP